ncbi:uncharacterized protein isoform X2 [Leptinotarsa decemlineata]|uniref:uncharacterized protein isoform X2 n=1 Tax=Leptinotarsa decemlineata TaxID=7539 RepID=UPI003D3075BC
MASKLRRTPLYSQESDFFSPRGVVSEVAKHPLKMECGVTGGYTNGATTPAGILADVRSERSPAKTGLHVNFKDKGEIKEKREKFLTAKYGHHQMSLIRKRLAVEMWLYEELKKLYESKSTIFDNVVANLMIMGPVWPASIEEYNLGLQKGMTKPSSYRCLAHFLLICLF